MSEPRTRSRAWYILPILMGIIGGIISYLAVKRDDPKLAKNCLKVGIIVLAINLIILGVSSFIGFFSEMLV